MNKRQFAKQLKKLEHSIVPSTAWKNQQRAFLVSRIQAQVSSRPIQQVNYQFVMNIGRKLAQPIGALGMGILVILGGLVASVSASTTSMPGDKLYSLKLTSEKVHVSLVTDKKAKTDLQIEHAKKRVEEIKEVVKREHDPIKANQQIQQPLQSLKVTVAAVMMAVEDAKTRSDEEALDIANTIKDVTVSASVVVKEAEVSQVTAADQTAESTLAVNTETQKSVDENISTSSEAQLGIIKSITEKDKGKGREALLAYVQEFKNENGLNHENTKDTESTEIKTEEVVTTEPAKAEVVVSVEPVKAEEVASVEPVAESVVPTEEVKLTDEEIAAKKAADEEAAVKAKAAEEEAAAKAKAEADKLKALEEMISKVEDLISKDDIMSALDVLIAYHQPKEEVKEEEVVKVDAEVVPEKPVE